MKILVIGLYLLIASSSALAEAVWVDVRSSAERFITKIEGDVHLPVDQVAAQASRVFPDKDAEIRFYCAAGVRAQRAMDALIAQGYTNVHNAGGIKDARRVREASN